jgi:hypothetical protein
MRFPPLSVQESWPTANYVDPITRGPVVLIVEITILSLAWICLALRMWVRFGILRRSWWDDWVMVIAAVFASGVTACVCLGKSHEYQYVSTQRAFVDSSFSYTEIWLERPYLGRAVRESSDG